MFSSWKNREMLNYCSWSKYGGFAVDTVSSLMCIWLPIFFSLCQLAVSTFCLLDHLQIEVFKVHVISSKRTFIRKFGIRKFHNWANEDRNLLCTHIFVIVFYICIYFKKKTSKKKRRGAHSGGMSDYSRMERRVVGWGQMFICLQYNSCNFHASLPPPHLFFN